MGYQTPLKNTTPSFAPSRIRKWNQLSQFRWTSTKVIPIEKNLSWLHFHNEPRVQERQQGKDQQSCISIFVTYPTISSSPTVFHAWLYGRFIEIRSNIRRKKLHRTNQGSNFLGGSFSNRDNIRAPIQFRRNSTPVS